MRALQALSIYFLLSLIVVQCFRWNINEVLPAGKFFSFSEGNMFADRNGPVLMDQGLSFINADVKINIFSLTDSSIDVGMAIYGAAPGHEDEEIGGLCNGKNIERAHPNKFLHNVQLVTFPTTYVNKVTIANPKENLNGTFYLRSVDVEYNYVVKNEEYHNVVFVLCTNDDDSGLALEIPTSQVETPSKIHSIQNGATQIRAISSLRSRSLPKNQQTVGLLKAGTDDDDAQPTDGTAAVVFPRAYISGTIAFHNPYGYLPAADFGLLPFQLARLIAYLGFAIFFIGHYIFYRESLLPLHTGFLVIFMFALVEATLWFASYEYLNKEGEPYCCPYPPLVIASLVMQVFRQTFERTLLLIVSLGYGIVRPKLMVMEWAAVSVMTVLYLTAAIISQSAVIMFAEHTPDGSYGSADEQQKLIPYRFPEMILDMLFLMWIYFAIGSTIRILTEFNQTVKLEMYNQLVTIIGVFVGFFVSMTFLFMFNIMVIRFIPWQLTWVEQVCWESLNFAVLAAVCVVCRPTPTSRLLSYASQLPTEDPDDDDLEMHGGSTHDFKWSNKGRDFVYDDEQDDSTDDDVENYFEVGRGGKGKPGGRGGEVEMSKCSSGLNSTRNPLTKGKSPTSPPSISPPPGHSNGYDKVGGSRFDVLPTAVDEEDEQEYGLGSSDKYYNDEDFDE